jgi:hypothetical protein
LGELFASVLPLSPRQVAEGLPPQVQGLGHGVFSPGAQAGVPLGLLPESVAEAIGPPLLRRGQGLLKELPEGAGGPHVLPPFPEEARASQRALRYSATRSQSYPSSGKQPSGHSPWPQAPRAPYHPGKTFAEGGGGNPGAEALFREGRRLLVELPRAALPRPDPGHPVLLPVLEPRVPVPEPQATPVQSQVRGELPKGPRHPPLAPQEGEDETGGQGPLKGQGSQVVGLPQQGEDAPEGPGKGGGRGPGLGRAGLEEAPQVTWGVEAGAQVLEEPADQVPGMVVDVEVLHRPPQGRLGLRLPGDAEKGLLPRTQAGEERLRVPILLQEGEEALLQGLHGVPAELCPVLVGLRGQEKEQEPLEEDASPAQAEPLQEGLVRELLQGKEAHEGRRPAGPPPFRKAPFPHGPQHNPRPSSLQGVRDLRNPPCPPLPARPILASWNPYGA